MVAALKMRNFRSIAGFGGGVNSFLRLCLGDVIELLRDLGLAWVITVYQGGDAVFDFSFSELYSFLLTALGMILSFFAGRRSKSKNDNNEK